jgi:spoIIIJ-associated protein
MSEAGAVSVEATGETVGEAKWAALRELEQLVPGLDRESVQFQVVSEGERGLLGVGFTPAHVIASAGAQARSSQEEDMVVGGVREIVERIAAGIGAEVVASARENEGVVTVSCSGPDVALFIGKHGQTIDAIQYLANAIARAEGAEHAVVVDAAGYRARRTATLETLARRTAQRASATGRRDDPEVETASEGSEPNRFVVVFPRPVAG